MKNEQESASSGNWSGYATDHDAALSSADIDVCIWLERGTYLAESLDGGAAAGRDDSWFPNERIDSYLSMSEVFPRLDTIFFLEVFVWLIESIGAYQTSLIRFSRHGDLR